MALTFRAASSGETSYGMTATINKPTGTAEDDLLVAVLMSDGGVSDETGWTTQESGTTTGGYGFKVMTKIAGGSEPASYEFDITTAPANMAGIILAYSGADTTTPIDVDGSTMDSSTAPSVTTTADDETVIRVYAGDTGAAPGLPSGHTSRINFAGTEFDLRGVDKTQATAGSTGTAAFSASGYEEGVATLAIKNSGGGGGSAGAPAVSPIRHVNHLLRR